MIDLANKSAIGRLADLLGMLKEAAEPQDVFTQACVRRGIIPLPALEIAVIGFPPHPWWLWREVPVAIFLLPFCGAGAEYLSGDCFPRFDQACWPIQFLGPILEPGPKTSPGAESRLNRQRYKSLLASISRAAPAQEQRKVRRVRDPFRNLLTIYFHRDPGLKRIA